MQKLTLAQRLTLRGRDPGLALLALTVALSGCGRTPNTAPDPGAGPASGSDASEVSQELAQYPEYLDDSGITESPEVTAEASADMGVAVPDAAIRPIHFWRTITDVRRSFEFAFSDSDSTGRPTTAVVTVHKALSGSFNILVGSPEDSVFGRDVVRKRLHDQWVRRILLKRVRVGDEARARWRIAGVSGVKVTSRDAETHIVSLRIQTAGFDSTVVHPLEIFRLRNVLHFEAGTEVELTVTTLRADDVVVLQHRDRRFRFHNNGDNTYTGVFPVRLLRGLHHLGVNALSNGTLYDDEARYDSQAWILPYVVRPTELASDVP